MMRLHLNPSCVAHAALFISFLFTGTVLSQSLRGTLQYRTDLMITTSFCCQHVKMGGPDAYVVSAPSRNEVTVMDWNGTDWQLRSTFAGTQTGEEFGRGLAMSGHNDLAIGSPGYDTATQNNVGRVQVYHYDGTNWTQRGTDIMPPVGGLRSGFSLAMPSPNTIAIGTPNDVLGLNNGAGDTGMAIVYDWNGTDWIQRGLPMMGRAVFDRAGYDIDMPDVNTLALGGFVQEDQFPAGPVGKDAPGEVSVFNWNGTAWVRLGSPITGEANGDAFGITVSMPDTDTIAVGAPFADNGFGFGSTSGDTMVYDYDGNNWLQRGATVEGTQDNSLFGFSVSMVDDNNFAMLSEFLLSLYQYDPISSTWVENPVQIQGAIQNPQDVDWLAPTALGYGSFNGGYIAVFDTSMVLGVADLANDLAIQAYPNPSAGLVTLKHPAAGMVQVSDLSGKLVSVQELDAREETTLQLPDAPGVYLLRVILDTGTEQTLRVIRE